MVGLLLQILPIILPIILGDILPNYHQENCLTTRDNYNNCIMDNCETWYDGCNTCGVFNNQITYCTEMMCYKPGSSNCLLYIPLTENDICYRFCEDNSQSFINRRDDCPINTECKMVNTDVISFDMCDNRALRCISKGH